MTQSFIEFVQSRESKNPGFPSRWRYRRCFFLVVILLGWSDAGSIALNESDTDSLQREQSMSNVTTPGAPATLPWIIPNSYLIRFRRDLFVDSDVESNNTDELRRALENEAQTLIKDDATARVTFVYSRVFWGFAVRSLSDPTAKSLANNPVVLMIEPDQLGFGGSLIARNIKSQGTTTTTTSSNTDPRVQLDPPSWGLDRLDRFVDHIYRYKAEGRNVTVFVLDSGIRSTHRDFVERVPFLSSPPNNVFHPKSRVICGLNMYEDQGLSCEDDVGHGTHVAGTVGGRTYGTAKALRSIVNVRILDSSNRGPYSKWIAALDWVVQQKLVAAAGNETIPMVVNMAAWGGISDTLNTAVDAVINAGIVFVTIAGNNNGQDACLYSPASVTSAITVAAIDMDDYAASYSNLGPCVDVWAPGSSIVSAWYTSDTASAVLSGTSMSSPHVSGVAAHYLQIHPNWTPAEVWNAMKKDAFPGVVLGLNNNEKGTNRHLRRMQSTDSTQPPNEDPMSATPSVRNATRTETDQNFAFPSYALLDRSLESITSPTILSNAPSIQPMSFPTPEPSPYSATTTANLLVTSLISVSNSSV